MSTKRYGRIYVETNGNLTVVRSHQPFSVLFYKRVVKHGLLYVTAPFLMDDDDKVVLRTTGQNDVTLKKGDV